MTRHEDLLQSYATELAAAKQFAEDWWARLHADELRKTGSHEAAARAVKARWPEGPPSHPRVLAVVRAYWLACQALNSVIERERRGGLEPPEPEYELVPGETPVAPGEDATEEQEVYPHVFVIEWLMDEGMDELADFLGALSYWPVGLEPNDRNHYV
jgi:hypothetical protein